MKPMKRMKGEDLARTIHEVSLLWGQGVGCDPVHGRDGFYCAHTRMRAYENARSEESERRPRGKIASPLR